MRILSICSCVVLLAAAFASHGGEKTGGDWPQWRGPLRNAISAETGLVEGMAKEGPSSCGTRRKWATAKRSARASSSLAIAQGKIFAMGDEPAKDAGGDEGKGKKKGAPKGDEFALTASTPTRASKFGKRRSAPTSTIVRLRRPRHAHRRWHGLYVISPQGSVACLETSSGSILWQKDMVKEFGGKMMSGWGYSESPTIDGDKLIVTPGGKKAALIALDKVTGAVIWMCEPPSDAGAGYSSIVFAEVGGIKQYITQLGTKLGLVGVDAKTGKFLWNYNKVAVGTAHIATPIVKDDYVFTSNAYGGGTALVKLVPDGKGGIQAEEQWMLTAKQLQNHHGGTVMIGDYIYGGHGQNQGAPFCLEWKTGKFAWGPEKAVGGGSAAVLAADGNLYFRYQNGVVALIEATPKGLNVKGRFEAHLADNDWPHPVIWHGKLVSAWGRLHSLL